MFLLDDSNVAVLYTIPFLVGLALPGWRSLVAGSAAFAVAACASATADGSLALALGLFSVLTAIGGLCCGLLTRAATLWIAPLSRHPYRFMAVAVAGYILPPTAYSGPAETMAWLKRPSEQVCAAAAYRVTATNMTLQVRAAPIFAVDVLHAIGSTDVRHLSFDSKRGLKEICGRELRDNQVIGPVAVNLYPWKFGGSHVQSWVAATCASPRDETLILVCRLADKKHPARRMVRATIYGSEMDAAILSDGNYAIEKRLHQRLLETSEPFVLVCEGDEASIADAALFCGAQQECDRDQHLHLADRGDALLNAKRYCTVMNEGVRLQVRQDDRTVSIALDYVDIDRKSDRHQIEFWLVTMVRICRQVTATRLALRHLRIRHRRD